MQHLQADTVKKLPVILSLQFAKGHVLCTFFSYACKWWFFYGKWFFLSPCVTLTTVWPLFSYHLRGSAWYSSPHIHRPWVHFALCENYWSGALQSEIWLLQGEHLPCTILICWMQWEAKINFHIVFSARRKRACEEKPRQRSFWQNASLIRFLCSWRGRQEEVAISKEPAVTVLLKRTRWEGESNIFSRAAYECTSVLNSSRHFIKRLISSAWNHIGCCEDESFFSSLWKPWGCNSNAPERAGFGCKNKAL